MGIKNLNKFLRDKSNTLFVPIHLSEYAYKKVAIDISLYLFKYKAVCGDNWLNAFVNLVCSLRRNEIHCVFIYDGPAPPEKELEKAKRKEEKEKLKKQVYDLEQALDVYHQTGVVEKILQDMYKRRRSPSNKRLLGKTQPIDMHWVEQKIKQKREQIIDICTEDFQYTKDLFNILEVPYYTAPSEAEKFCSKLCIDGLVDAVLSEDTDIIAYGTPVFLSKLDTNQDCCVQVLNTEILESISLSQHQLLDLCIMSGTDYNNNIFRIGGHKAYNLIKEHNDIDGIAENTNLDTSILKHIRVRELFTEFETYDMKSIPYCGKPNYELLESFVQTHKLEINIEKIKQHFRKEIIFADSDDD
jgi:5'-3' exonuclease